MKEKRRSGGLRDTARNDGAAGEAADTHADELGLPCPHK